MEKTFEYCVKITKEAEIIVEDIGNTCIEAMSEFGNLFYLIIRTSGIGWTKTMTYGPVSETTDSPQTCSCILNCFEYDEYKLNKTIQSFLTDSKKRIVFASEVDMHEIKDKLRDIKEFIYES